MEKFQLSDFTRDIRQGDTGEDVGKIQTILKFFGYEISADETQKNNFGKSTQAAADKWREDFSKNPVYSFFAEILLKIVFGIEPDELTPGMSRGGSKPVKHYYESSDKELNAIEAATFGKSGSKSRIVNLANSFVGQRETGENRGAIVRKVSNGKEGQAWCGNFVNYVMDHSIGEKVYDQTNYASALSFKQEAQEHGAFRTRGAYVPHTGDVVVFTRGGGGHVGIVTEVKDGVITYVAGNDGDAVRARTMNLNDLPKSLLGFSDTQALAAAKHVTLEQGAPMLSISNPKISISAHSDKAIARA